MECRWIKDINEFKEIAEEWDNALIDIGEENPFLLSDFILTWWKYYLNNRKLMIFLISDNNRIISGIPLCTVRKKIKNVIEYIGGCAANLTHFFSADKNLNFIDNFIGFLQKENNWDILVLNRVLQNNPIIGYIQKNLSLNSPDSNLRYKIIKSGFNGVIDLIKGYDFVVGNLPKRLNRYLGSGKKKARLMGGLKLKKYEGSADIRNLFKEYKDMSIRSFRMRNAYSAFEDMTNANFFGDLLEVFDKKGRLDAHRLTIGDEALAISFGYRFGKGYKWILTTFNPDFQKLRPGHLLIDLLIQEAISNGDPYFDMYYGGELFYKQQWCNRIVPINRIVIYRNTFINKSILSLEGMAISNKSFMYFAKKIRNYINSIFIKFKRRLSA